MMKALVTSLAFVTTLIAAACQSDSQGPLGNVALASAEGATVTNDFACALPAAASGLGIDLFTTDPVHSTETPSGNTVLSCHFDIPDGFEPAKAIRNDGFLCNTFLGPTLNSMSVATPGGKATLTCQINGSDS
jgi:hypothetical protein